ncbi:MAG: hypothetical protein RI973_1521, partial [Bacteroidota bacterium]
MGIAIHRGDFFRGCLNYIPQVSHGFRKECLAGLWPVEQLK